MIVSLTSILIYRACIRDQMFSSSDESEVPESICPTSESCKYEMNTRHIEESFFQNQVEPVGNQLNNNNIGNINNIKRW